MTYYPFAPETGAEYTLVSPTGAIAVFNNQLDANYAAMLTEVTGLDAADVRESADDLIEADGGVHGNFYMGRRPITMSGRIFGHASVAERNLRADRISRSTMALRGDAILSWRPSTRRENWVRNPQASPTGVNALNAFVGSTGGTGGSSTGAFVATDGFDAASGTTSAAEWAVTAQTGGTGSYVAIFHQRYGSVAQLQTDAMPVDPGQYVYAHTAFKNVGANVPSLVQLWVRFHDAAGTFISQPTVAGTGSIGTVNNPTTGTWYRLHGTAQAPAGAAWAVIRIAPSLTAATAYTFRTDALTLGPARSANDLPGYMDGNPSTAYWQDGVNASMSADYVEMFTYVRRQQPLRFTGAWNKDFQIQLVSEFAPLYGLNLRVLTAASGTAVAPENQGSYTSFPILNITGASTNPVVTNSTIGLAFRTTGLTLAAGETLTVDTLNHTANFTAGARNGQSGNRYIDYINTAWPVLPTGVNSVTLTGGGSLTLQWRDTWA